MFGKFVEKKKLSRVLSTSEYEYYRFNYPCKNNDDLWACDIYSNLALSPSKVILL
jgi:hypothetical protein